MGVPSLRTRREQKLEIGLGQDALPRTAHRTGHDRVVQFELPLFEGNHLFLNTVAHENPHDRNGSLLPDTVRAVRRLVLYRRIPPGVQMKHITRFGEIQPLAPGLETQQKHARLFAGLKRRHPPLARKRRGRAVQPVVRYLVPDAGFLHKVQKTGELRKDQGAVPFFQQDLQPLHQETDLGRGLVGPVRQEARRKTDLAELEMAVNAMNCAWPEVLVR